MEKMHGRSVKVLNKSEKLMQEASTARRQADTLVEAAEASGRLLDHKERLKEQVKTCARKFRASPVQKLLLPGSS